MGFSPPNLSHDFAINTRNRRGRVRPKRRYASASFVGKNRVVFNIKGNDYRLVVAVAYRFQGVYIKFVGTHAQYDKIDAATAESA